VEHLLRDIKDTTVGTLSQRITNQLLGLKGLHEQIREIRDYLLQVCIYIYIAFFLPLGSQIISRSTVDDFPNTLYIDL